MDIAPSENISYRRLRPPKYPPQAVRQRMEGKVVLKVLVGLDGKPEEITVEKTSGYRVLDQAAIAAVKTWVFNAGQKNGAASRGYALVPIEFKMPLRPRLRTSQVPCPHPCQAAAAMPKPCRRWASTT